MSAIVMTRSGRVEGNYENGQWAFKGIPYAAPPVGRLRWGAPQPVKPWDGVRAAKEYGTIAPQNTLPGAEILAVLMAGEPQDENCLFLNIWTPNAGDTRRPVMVWLHGGAFLIGSGSQEMFRNNTLVTRGDVVLVTINYRMGALGFMNLKEVTGGKIPATGCEGLLDQIAALDWIRENIEAFGGDPNNITVFGESAGAMSIGDLLGMPSAKGKFHKAILESGGPTTIARLDDGIAVTGQFLEILGINPEDTEALYALSVPHILDAQQKLGILLREKENRLTPFLPVVDGVVIPEAPLEAIKKGSAAGIPTLAGTNLDEFKLFNALDSSFKNVDDAGMRRYLNAMIPPEQVSNVIAAYQNGRAQRGESASVPDVLTAIQSDFMFRMPVLRLVEAQEKNQQPTYNYLFTWKSPVMRGRLGACHTLEIGFVFGNYTRSFCGIGPDADALSHRIQDAWIAFARTGNPSCASLGVWNPYADDRTTMILDKNCQLEKAPYEEERCVWDSFAMNYTKPI
jgi:para-nitrobenzyl esterase